MRLAVLDLPEGNAMRAPGEAPGMMALEIAMDEMAEKLGLDPVEFRILNDTQVDPEKPGTRPILAASPCASACARAPSGSAGASATRNPGRCATGTGWSAWAWRRAFRDDLLIKSAARVRLDEQRCRDGRNGHDRHRHRQLHHHRADCGRDDGRAARQVVVRLGDSSFPVSSGSGGQWGANSSTAGVYAACVKLREAVAQRLGFNSAEAVFADGQVRAGNRSVPLAEAAGGGDLVAEDTIEYGDLTRRTSSRPSARISSRSASTPLPARSASGACSRCAPRAASSIPKTARSQVIGAMTMGVGAALMEELAVDKRLGFFVNHDLAGYEVPVHADIPHQEVIFLDETDPSRRR